MLVYSPLKIVALREERDWNQSELARRAGLSAPTIWAYERGEVRMPKFKTLTAIARALGVPLSAIMADKVPEGAQDELLAAWGALTPSNRGAALAAIKALLESQKKK